MFVGGSASCSFDRLFFDRSFFDRLFAVHLGLPAHRLASLLHKTRSSPVVLLPYLDELVVVVVAVEERLLPENHAGEHAAEAPQVQPVVVLLQASEWVLATAGLRKDGAVGAPVAVQSHHGT